MIAKIAITQFIKLFFVDVVMESNTLQIRLSGDIGARQRITTRMIQFRCSQRNVYEISAFIKVYKNDAVLWKMTMPFWRFCIASQRIGENVTVRKKTITAKLNNCSILPLKPYLMYHTSWTSAVFYRGGKPIISHEKIQVYDTICLYLKFEWTRDNRELWVFVGRLHNGCDTRQRINSNVWKT